MIDRFQVGQHVRYVAQVEVAGGKRVDYLSIPWLTREDEMVARIREERERLRTSQPAVPKFYLVRRVITNETLIAYSD